MCAAPRTGSRTAERATTCGRRERDRHPDPGDRGGEGLRTRRGGRSLRRQCDPGARGARGGAQAPRHVHRLHRRARPAPPDLGDRGQRGRRGPRRALRPDRRHPDLRRRDPCRGQRPRHPDRHGSRPGVAGGHPGPDHAPRGRQVRWRRLQGLRRSARCRRLGRQRPVQPPRGRGAQPRPRVAPELHDRRPGRSARAGAPDGARRAHRHHGDLLGLPGDLRDHDVLPRDDLEPVPRVRLPQQGSRDRGP